MRRRKRALSLVIVRAHKDTAGVTWIPSVLFTMVVLIAETTRDSRHHPSNKYQYLWIGS